MKLKTFLSLLGWLLILCLFGFVLLVFFHAVVGVCKKTSDGSQEGEAVENPEAEGA
jgi:succinate dehydrogenase/fumarate reductase cytochrome b subunit